MMLYKLKLWVILVVNAVADKGKCPGSGGCEVRQIGTPEFVTRLLQCDGPSCQNAIFAPSPNLVCLIRSTASTVRIYLSNCSNFDINTGYFITDTASVMSSKKGTASRNTVFIDKSCRTTCNAIEVITYKASNGMTLIANSEQVVTSSNVNCSQGLYVYPDAEPTDLCESGLDGQKSQNDSTGKKEPFARTFKTQRPSETRQCVLLKITDDKKVLTVGAPERLSAESYSLPIVEEHNVVEVFYAREYSSRAVGANGTIEHVRAYTLQLARSKKYLVADVLDDTTLNYTGPNSTGLNLKDASEFKGGYARKPDYRFFVQYNVTINRVTKSVFCPLFHRNYCIYPGVSGYLRLTPLKSTDRSLEPTFVNPTESVLRNFILYSVPPGTGTSWHVHLSFL